jgi:hypothetical protein
MVLELKVTTLGPQSKAKISLVHFILLKEKLTKMLTVTNIKILFYCDNGNTERRGVHT